MVAVDFCCSKFLSLAIVVAKSVGSSYTGEILSSSNSRSAAVMLSPQRPLCSVVERPSKDRVDLSGATVGAAFLSSFVVITDGLDLGVDFGNSCGITAAVADTIPSLRAIVIVPYKNKLYVFSLQICITQY